MDVIPKRGEAPTWESPANNAGDCTPRAFPRFARGTTPACALVRNDIKMTYTSTSRPVLELRKMESISLTIIAPSLMWM